jgi:tetratricopeptide (TPR) repeat protein
MGAPHTRMLGLALALATGLATSTNAQALDLEARKAVFGEVNAAFAAGRKAMVADGLVTIVENPDQADYHAEAYARLGGTLEDLDLPYSALAAYNRALQTDAEGVSSVVGDALRLADAVGDSSMLQAVFADNVGLDVDANTRAQMAYLAARETMSAGNYGTALGILKLVGASTSTYPEAKALEGVTLAMQGKHSSALASLLTAKGAADASDMDIEDKARFGNLISLNLGRAYFGTGNFPRAIEYYAQVDRGSHHWPEAQFERAWAHFRLDDMNGTLSLLHNHNSPFLESWYFPEGALLRVYALFLLCKFPDASTQIDHFQTLYNPQLANLRELASLSPEALFNEAAAETEKGSSTLPAHIGRAMANEDRFTQALHSVRQAEDEIARLRNVSANPFSYTALEWLVARKKTLVMGEGQRIADRLSRDADDLSMMLNDSQMSKLDLLQMETQMYTRAAVTGKAPEARRTVNRNLRLKKGYQTWPFEGEYWMDELGYFRIKSKPECPAGLQSGE